jgi:hypothetical protein
MLSWRADASCHISRHGCLDTRCGGRSWLSRSRSSGHERRCKRSRPRCGFLKCERVSGESGLGPETRCCSCRNGRAGGDRMRSDWSKITGCGSDRSSGGGMRDVRGPSGLLMSRTERCRVRSGLECRSGSSRDDQGGSQSVGFVAGSPNGKRVYAVAGFGHEVGVRRWL